MEPEASLPQPGVAGRLADHNAKRNEEAEAHSCDPAMHCLDSVIVGIMPLQEASPVRRLQIYSPAPADLVSKFRCQIHTLHSSSSTLSQTCYIEDRRRLTLFQSPKWPALQSPVCSKQTSSRSTAGGALQAPRE